MPTTSFGARWIGATALGVMVCQPVAGQVVEPGRVYPVELVSPIYPPIAVSARVAGDVTVVVRVRPDGGVVDVAVTSGPPLLVEAGRRAAKASRFECQACVGEQAHTITYVFGLEDMAPRAPAIDLSGSRVYIVAEAPIAIIDFSYVSVRSAKCLYLWHCARQWGGMDFYNYKVRSGRCAWLWKCGWRRRTTDSSGET